MIAWFKLSYCRVLLILCALGLSAGMAFGQVNPAVGAAPTEAKDNFRLLFDVHGGFKLYRQDAQDGSLHSLLNPEAEFPTSFEIYRDGVALPLTSLDSQPSQGNDPGFRGPAFAAGELHIQLWGLDLGPGASSWSAFRYEIQNTGKSINTVSLRVIMDTWLAENTRDHATLVQLDKGAKQSINDETRLLPQDSAQIIYQQRSGSSDAFALLLASKKSASILPQRVIVANIRRLQNNPAYEFEEHRAFNLLPFSVNDSAIGLFYDSVVLAPNQKIAIDIVIAGQVDVDPQRVQLVQERLNAIKTSAEIAKTPDRPTIAKNPAVQKSAEAMAKLNALIDKLNIMLKDPHYRQGELENLLAAIEEAKKNLQPGP